jgi:hypothetical protein
MAEPLCAHETCACPPEPGSAFCGPACAEEERTVRRSERSVVPCHCGHDTCRPENVDPHQPPPEAQPGPALRERAARGPRSVRARSRRTRTGGT